MRNVALLPLGLFAAAFVFGCTPKTDSKPADTPPAASTSETAPPAVTLNETDYEGWKTLTGKSGTYTIRVPKEFVSNTEQSAEVDKAVAEVAKSSPELAAVFKGTAGSSQLDLYAMDLNPEAAKDGFADNINVIVEPWEASGDLETSLKQVGEATAKGLPATTELETDVVEVAGTKAFRYSAGMEFPDGKGGKLTSHLTGYLVPNAGKIYIVSMSTKAGEKESAAVKFDKIIKSLTFK